MKARLPMVQVMVLASSLLALCVASWCATSAAALWQPHSATTLSTHTVYAYRQWQSVGLFLKAGDQARLTASGLWTYSPEVGLHGPEGGMPAPDYYPLPTARGGALLGRLGEAGNVFYVGHGLTYVAPEPGFLYLRINDDLLGDNVGALTLKIEVEPAPTAPARN
jgi:hypothetical protein